MIRIHRRLVLCLFSFKITFGSKDFREIWFNILAVNCYVNPQIHGIRLQNGIQIIKSSVQSNVLVLRLKFDQLGKLKGHSGK